MSTRHKIDIMNTFFLKFKKSICKFIDRKFVSDIFLGYWKVLTEFTV